MSDKKNFQSQIVKRRHSKHFAFRCLLDFRNLADFKDSEIPIIDWGALSLTNIFLTCKPVYILYLYICLYLIYNPRSDLTTITWQGLAQLLRRWLRHWEFGKRYWYDIQYSDWRIQNGHHLWNSRKEYLWWGDTRFNYASMTPYILANKLLNKWVKLSHSLERKMMGYVSIKLFLIIYWRKSMSKQLLFREFLCL